MNCPVCNVALNMTERQGVEIDYCPKCRGVWLDRGSWIRLSSGRPPRRLPDRFRSLIPSPVTGIPTAVPAPGTRTAALSGSRLQAAPAPKGPIPQKDESPFWASCLILIDSVFNPIFSDREDHAKKIGSFLIVLGFSSCTAAATTPFNRMRRRSRPPGGTWNRLISAGMT